MNGRRLGGWLLVGLGAAVGWGHTAEAQDLDCPSGPAPGIQFRARPGESKAPGPSACYASAGSCHSAFKISSAMA